MNNSFNGLIEGRDFEYAELPSKGECYPHKKSRMPVRYMTADDENLFASQTLWEKNQVGDELLKRLILDEDFEASELCVGDREALLCYIYRTTYGNSIITDGGLSVDLSTVKIKPFYMFADEDGYFDYVAADGQVMQFRYLTYSGLLKLNEMKHTSEIDFEREYLKQTLKENLYPDMSDDDISKLYRFITYTAPGLDTELILGDSIFLKFE